MSEKQDSAPNTPQDIKISGRFDQYRSSYWAAAVAVLPIRYAARPFLSAFWDQHEPKNFLKKHSYSALAGVFMQGVAGFYAHRTLQDMKSICSEALACEFNKDPKDVTFTDFRNSKNTIVQQTVKNYISYNLRRFGVNTTFFLPFILQPFLKNNRLFQKMRAENGVDLGVAANAAYLFRDVIVRKITPFEEIQSLIDRKINQSDHFTDQIQATDLMDVYERHATEGYVKSFLSKRGTAEWPGVQELFERMSDLVNQTYKNTQPHEHADFGFPQFIYLVGNGLIEPDQMEKSRGFVELANKHGVGAVKEANKELQDGVPLNKVMQEYDIHPPHIETPISVEPDLVPTASLKPHFEVQPSGFSKHLKHAEKPDMSLAFQDKIRQQQVSAPAEGLAV
jgi:hypothetical protein